MEQILMEYVVNAVWQIPLLAAAAWLFLRLGKFSPRTQHCIWLAVLALAVGLPLRGAHADLPPTASASCAACNIKPIAPVSGEANSSIATLHNSGAAGPGWLEEFAELPAPKLRLSNTATHSLVGFYLAALFFGLYRVMAAWRAAQRLVANSRATMLPPQWQTMFEDSGRRLAARLPDLRESDALQSPVIVGVLRPVLLLPEKFVHHTQDEAQAVFYHELAHVYRHDYLVNLICRLVASPVVWHPAIYGVQQRIRRTREMICDEIAAREMQSEIGYAKCLLAMARRTLGQRDLADSAQAMGLFSDNRLEERMMRLVESKSTMTLRVKLARVAGGATVMIAATAMAALFHVTPTLAQSKVEPSPVVVQSQVIGDQVPTAATKPIKNPVMAEDAAASPVPPVQPQAKTSAKHGTVAHRQKTIDQKQFVIEVDKSPALTAEQQAQLQQEMDAMRRQVAEATKQLDSPEFKQRMADIQQMQEKLNTIELPKIQQQIDNATARINSPEFKQQMANLQKQLENGELQRRMEEVNRELKQSEAQRQQSLRALNMSKIQQQIDAATAKIPPAKPEYRFALAPSIGPNRHSHSERPSRVHNHQHHHQHNDSVMP